MNNIFYPVYQPSIIGNAKKYTLECIDSGWISSKGRFVKLFEEKFSDFQGGGYSSSVTNGTVALHLALKVLDIKKDDEIIVPSLTYIASVNAIKYVEAKPIFIDSDLSSWNIDTSKIEEKITKKTKAIIAVHLYGAMCNMQKLKDICEKHNLFLIEDAAEAFGSDYKGKKSGTFGDIATFSFFGNKTITTGEGGMVYSNDEEKIKRVASLKNQAVSSEREYWHEEIGYNYRMTNICAAIGLAQLEVAEDLISKKQQIAFWYKEYLKNIPITFQKEEIKSFHSFWMVTILVKEKSQRDKLRYFLKDNNIDTRPVFYPANKMKPYKTTDLFAVANLLSNTGLNLPSYPDLKESDIKFICDKIKSYFNN